MAAGLDALKEKLAAGEPAFGSMVFEFFTPGIARICANAGAEFVMYCMEHTGAGYETLKPQFALCRALGVAPLVRIPATEYHFAARALDAGALGIMVPLVDTAEQAERIVSFTRYPPKGRRGAAFGFTADDYMGGSVTDIIKVADERTLVMCLIETAEGVENVDEIAAVPGVDVLWLGHFDLTNFLGIPAQFDHPKYKEAIRKMVAAARKHGKVLACMTGDDKWSKEYWELGFRLFGVGVDNFLLQSAIRSGMKTLHELAGKQ